MKHILLLFCFFIICTSCEQNQEHIYVPTKYDQLDFLVENSDLIAVIDILDGYPRSSNDLKNNKESYQARIVEAISSKSNDIISIDIVPYYNNKNGVVGVPVLREGLSLAFLKQVDVNKYKPLTDLSVITIYGGKLSPVWKQSTSSGKFDIFEFNISEIKTEITAEIKNRNGKDQGAHLD